MGTPKNPHLAGLGRGSLGHAEDGFTDNVRVAALGSAKANQLQGLLLSNLEQALKLSANWPTGSVLLTQPEPVLLNHSTAVGFGAHRKGISELAWPAHILAVRARQRIAQAALRSNQDLQNVLLQRFNKKPPPGNAEQGRSVGLEPVKPFGELHYLDDARLLWFARV